MKKLLQNDIFLRIFSLALAIFCWIYIVFITNPEIEVKINNVPVTLANHQAIKNEGYIVSSEVNTTVNIKVKGSRRMLANLDESSIIAYVDLIDCTDKKTFNLPVNIKLPYDGISLVSSNITKIPVSIDNYVTKDFPVEYSYTGELKDSHYSVNSTEIYTPTVTVSGPEPILNTVERATITIDLKNATDDISGFAPIKFLNSNNAEVSPVTLDIKNRDISFKCVVYAKKVVPIQPVLSDSANYEAKIQGDSIITIEGPASKINAISSIPTSTIHVYEANAVYPVKPILPEGVTAEENIHTVYVQVTKK